MKKTLLILVVLLIGSSVYAGSTMDMTGDDWIEMTREQKEYFILGMFMGLDIIRECIADSPTGSNIEDENGFTTDDYMTYMADYFVLGTTVAEATDNLDAYYRFKANRDYYIWSSIMFIYEKIWW